MRSGRHTPISIGMPVPDSTTTCPLRRIEPDNSSGSVSGTPAVAAAVARSKSANAAPQLRNGWSRVRSSVAIGCPERKKASVRPRIVDAARHCGQAQQVRAPALESTELVADWMDPVGIE